MHAFSNSPWSIVRNICLLLSLVTSKVNALEKGSMIPLLTPSFLTQLFYTATGTSFDCQLHIFVLPFLQIKVFSEVFFLYLLFRSKRALEGNDIERVWSPPFIWYKPFLCVCILFFNVIYAQNCLSVRRWKTRLARVLKKVLSEQKRLTLFLLSSCGYFLRVSSEKKFEPINQAPFFV